jgi:hypothetical protein
MSAELAEIAYDASLRRLDKQERLLDDLRARTGLLLAAASLAATPLRLRYSLGAFAIAPGPLAN